MNTLLEFLKILIRAAPDVLPVVTGALKDWQKLSPDVAKDLIRKITPSAEGEIDARIDSEGDAARRAAGLDLEDTAADTLIPGPDLEPDPELESDPESIRRIPGKSSILEILEDDGIDVQDERIQGRPFPFEPCGIIVHHTATGGSADLPTLGLLKNGMPRLPAPICQILIGRTGTVVVISDGYCNHAGGGRPAVLALLKAGLPMTEEALSGAEGVGGNRWTIGVEVENAGNGEPYSIECMESIHDVCAALCRAYGWTEDSVIGHREWSSRKIDPLYSCVTLRANIADLLD